jgi:hypothetical protein
MAYTTPAEFALAHTIMTGAEDESVAAIGKFMDLIAAQELDMLQAIIAKQHRGEPLTEKERAAVERITTQERKN